VGPTRTYLTPKDVPWLKLMPCDQVLIDYRAEPYRDMLFIASRGEKNKYITVKGLPGPNGERPVFDGANAVTATNVAMGAVYDGKAMISIAPPDRSVGAAYGYKPGYLHITGLNIKNARAASRYTNLSRAVVNWPVFSSGIYAIGAEHLAITNCELADNGLGIFVNSINGEAYQSRWLLISGNYFHNNGESGNASMHNAYTEAIGTIYEFNYFGQPVSGTAGDNVKERSAGVIFRYNYLEGGVYGLSLRDPQSNGDHEALAKDTQGDLLTKHAFVYSNILRLRGSSDTMIGHGDGAYGDGKQHRHGNLFFYNNKVVHDFEYAMYNRDTVNLFQFLNTRSLTTAIALNNIFYAKGALLGILPSPFALVFWGGAADFRNNWINSYTLTHPNWSARSSGVFVGTQWTGTGLNGMIEQTGTPGFSNLTTGDYASTSDATYTAKTDNLPAEIRVRGLIPAARPVQTPALTISE
jgi:hypothetical protein